MTINVPDAVLEIEAPILGSWQTIRDEMRAVGNMVVRRLSDGDVFLIQDYGDQGLRMHHSVNGPHPYRTGNYRHWATPSELVPWSGSAVGYCRTGLQYGSMPDDVSRVVPPLVIPADATVESLTALRDTYRAGLAADVPENRVRGLAETWMSETVSIKFNEVANENNMCPVYEQRLDEFNEQVPGPLHLLTRAETDQRSEVEYTVELDVPFTYTGSYTVTVSVTAPPGLDCDDLRDYVNEQVDTGTIFNENRAVQVVRYDISAEFDDGFSIESYDEN